ncbi:hypothetical protein ACUIAJ_02635 [Dermabacteraceae bacterium CCM 9519]
MTASKSVTVRVMNAQFRRSLAPGGVRRGLIVAVITGWAGGILSVFLGTMPEVTNGTPFTVSEVAFAAILLSTVLFLVSTSSFVTRDIENGVLTWEKALVPSIGAIFGGRILAWAGLSVMLSVASMSIPVLAGFAIPEISTGSIGSLVAGILAPTLASVLVCVIIYFIAIIVRKGAYVVATALVLLIIAPFIFAAVGMFFPALQGIAFTLSSWLIGTVAVQAMILPSEATGMTVGTFILAWVKLLTWVVATGAIGYAFYHHESFDYRR